MQAHKHAMMQPWIHACVPNISLITRALLLHCRLRAGCCPGGAGGAAHAVAQHAQQLPAGERPAFPLVHACAAGLHQVPSSTIHLRSRQPTALAPTLSCCTAPMLPTAGGAGAMGDQGSYPAAQPYPAAQGSGAGQRQRPRELIGPSGADHHSEGPERGGTPPALSAARFGSDSTGSEASASASARCPSLLPSGSCCLPAVRPIKRSSFHWCGNSGGSRGRTPTCGAAAAGRPVSRRWPVPRGERGRSAAAILRCPAQ